MHPLIWAGLGAVLATGAGLALQRPVARWSGSYDGQTLELCVYRRSVHLRIDGRDVARAERSAGRPVVLQGVLRNPIRREEIKVEATWAFRDDRHQGAIEVLTARGLVREIIAGERMVQTAGNFDALLDQAEERLMRMKLMGTFSSEQAALTEAVAAARDLADRLRATTEATIWNHVNKPSDEGVTKR